MEDFYDVYTGAEVEQYAQADEAARAYNLVAMGNGENPNEGDDLVLPGFGCPSCHERRPDFLIIGDDDYVTCQSCGRVYGLPDGLYDEWDEAYSMTALGDWYALAHPGACM